MLQHIQKLFAIFNRTNCTRLLAKHKWTHTSSIKYELALEEIDSFLVFLVEQEKCDCFLSVAKDDQCFKCHKLEKNKKG